MATLLHAQMSPCMQSAHRGGQSARGVTYIFPSGPAAVSNPLHVKPYSGVLTSSGEPLRYNTAAAAITHTHLYVHDAHAGYVCSCAIGAHTLLTLFLIRANVWMDGAGGARRMEVVQQHLSPNVFSFKCDVKKTPGPSAAFRGGWSPRYHPTHTHTHTSEKTMDQEMYDHTSVTNLLHGEE